MDVTHWPWGRICVTDLSADRKAVRIAKGYLSFITKGAEVGARAGMRDRPGTGSRRSGAGRGGIPAPRVASLNAA